MPAALEKRIKDCYDAQTTADLGEPAMRRLGFDTATCAATTMPMSFPLITQYKIGRWIPQPPKFEAVIKDLRGHSIISPIISTLDACVTGGIAQRTTPQRTIINKIARILEKEEILKKEPWKYEAMIMERKGTEKGVAIDPNDTGASTEGLKGARDSNNIAWSDDFDTTQDSSKGTQDRTNHLADIELVSTQASSSGSEAVLPVKTPAQIIAASIASTKAKETEKIEARLKHEYNARKKVEDLTPIVTKALNELDFAPV